MQNVLGSLGYLLLGLLLGLIIAAVAASMARRRRYLDEALNRAYSPLLALLAENGAARAKVADLEERLMANYSSESAPYSAPEKKAAAEAFLGVEARIGEAIVAANAERVREIVAAWGHLLDDDDYLALADEAAAARLGRLVAAAALPKALRDAPPNPRTEAALLEQVRFKFLERSAERRARFFPALVQGLKHLFSQGRS
jgi:hypothetical protein